jgi:hypothetical protein
MSTYHFLNAVPEILISGISGTAFKKSGTAFKK